MTDAIYNRTITVNRSQPNTAIGVQAYSGLTPAEYAPVFVDGSNNPLSIAASIQEKGTSSNPVKLPSDSAKVQWKIHFIVANQSTPGLVKDRDLIIDDESIRYQVVAARHTLLNWQCLCERLEA